MFMLLQVLNLQILYYLQHNVEFAKQKITLIFETPHAVQAWLRLEEFYSYTEKIQQKRTRKTNQNKGKLCTANNYIQ